MSKTREMAPDDRIIISHSFSHHHAGQIVVLLVADYLEADGYTAPPERIALGPLLQRVNFNYVSVEEALNKISEVSGIPWWIDEGKQVHFGPQT